MKRHRISILFTLFVSLLMVAPVQAYQLPAVNLGLTSFLDGGPPAGPGFYVTQYGQYFAGDEFLDENGENAGLALNPEIDVWLSMTQFIYQSDTDIFLGGKWGVNLMIPYVGFDLDLTQISANGGIGDIVFGPFLQWGPIMGQSGPIFMHRIELSMMFPTGDYDRNRTLNAGSNFFSFNPYWAATLFITPRWTLSWRVHYLWNAENDDPTTEMNPPFATETQAGQAVHVNYAMAFEVVPKWFRVGVNGYWLKQTTENTINGNDVTDYGLGTPFTKEQAFAIGPGAVIHFGQNAHLFFNAYFESAVENRPEGNRFTLRFVGHF
ncbi:transporter [Thermodesulfobacteriota bacterium]